ncbi:MAG: YihA family ribosome biogenesis GTP-binding protein [Magnetococcales bacterium]|nr:YihA family ribosome biogenesis GTP-binding protein [Magnetococcales bacterium]
MHTSSPIHAGLSSQFIAGAVSRQHFPPDDLPEVAFAGRSNVGKSSILNRLLNRRNLARVSRTPGRTREINFFLVGTQGRFVDLPGYGFAEVARNQRLVWDRVAESYFNERRSLRGVILLLDPRRGLLDSDLALIAYLEERGIGFLPVATKIDKLKANPRRQALIALAGQIRESTRLAMAPPVAVSSLNGDGVAELWQHLEKILGDG